MAINSSNSALAGLSGKIALNNPAGKVQPSSSSLSTIGINAPPSASVGVKAASPVTTVKKPATTLPTSQKAAVQPPSSDGAYKGVPIDIRGDIGAQIAKIDGQQTNPAAVSSTKPAPSYPGLMGAQIQAKDQQAQITPQATPTYSGLVGSLANASHPSAQQQSLTSNLASAANPTNMQTSLVKGLRDAGNANTAIGQQGQDIANLYAPEIGRVGGLGAAAQAGYNSTGTNVVGAGNAAIASQSASQRMSALAQAEQAQLYGVDKQLAAQGQLQSAYGTGLAGANTQQAQQLAGLGAAANTANTQQAQQLSGLGAAAGYAQPQLGSVGQVPFNPLEQSQGAILGSTQSGGLNAAGNLLGQFQGAQAAGAAPGQAQAGIIGTQTQQIAGYQSALQQGQNLQSQLSDLIHTFNLNPADINAVNQGIQKIAQNVSDPRYKILQNYVNDIANTYAQVLTPPGGSATDTTRGIASSMLDATASGQSLQAVMQSLDAAARAKIAGVSTMGASNGSTGNNGGGIVQTKAGPVNTSW